MREVYHRTSRSFLLASLILVVTSGCEIIDPQEQLPAYVHIPAIVLDAAPGQGTSSHNITDAWIYIDQEVQGIYELPATFPVLEEGTHTVTVRPGIKINGIASTRIYYPFFRSQDFDVTFDALKTDTLLPVARYTDQVLFAWMEDFESPGLSFEELPSSDTTLVKVYDNDKVFEGSASAGIFLDADHDLFQGMTNEAFELPGGQQPTYLEMNFRCNTRFLVGLVANGIGNTSVLDILVLNPTGEWKKVYVNLGATVSRQTGVLDYNIYLRAGLDEGLSEGEVLIDNLKLLHY